MWELFTHPSNLIFSICLSLMFLLGLLELILLVLGGGSQGLLDQFFLMTLAVLKTSTLH